MAAGQNLRVGITTAYSGGMTRVSRDLRGVGTSATFAARAFDHFGTRSTRALRGVTHMMSRQVGNVFRSFFFGIRIYAIMAGAAVSGFVVTAIKSFNEFDKKLRETTSLIAGAGAASGSGSLAARLKKARKEAQKEYDIYRRDLLTMAVGLRTTPQALAAGIYEPVSAGYSGRGQSGIVKQLLKTGAMGAVAGGGEVQTSVRLLIQTMNALGIKKPNRRGANGQFITGGPLSGKRNDMAIMNRIFQAVNFGVGVTFPDLSAALGNVIGPIGAAMNPGGTNTPGKGMKALEQVLASVVIGSQRGLTASKVTIGLADIVKRIQKPTKEAQDMYAAMFGGKGLPTGAALMKGGLIGSGIGNQASALERIIKGLKSLGYNKKTMSEGLFKLFGDIRAQRLLTTFLNTTLKDTDSVLKLISKSSGATKAAFDEQGRSMQGTIDKFKALTEVMKIQIGAALTPTVGRAMGSLTDLMNKITGGERGAQLGAMREKFAGLSPEQFAGQFFTKPGDAAAYRAHVRFTRSSFTGQMGMAFGAMRDSIVSWWNKPGTQKMLGDALQTALDKAIGLLDAAIDNMPSVYNLGVHLGGKIAEGMIRGLVPNLGGKAAGATGGGGLLQGTSIQDRLIGMLIGGFVFKATNDRFVGGGVQNRLGRGLGLAGAAGLAGVPSMLLPAFGAMGALMPGGIFGRIGRGSTEAALAEAAAGSPGAITRINANVVQLYAKQLVAAGGGGGGGGGAVTRANDPFGLYATGRRSRSFRPGAFRFNGQFMSQRDAVAASIMGAGYTGGVNPILATIPGAPSPYGRGAQFREYLRTISMQTGPLTMPTTASGIILPAGFGMRTGVPRFGYADSLLRGVSRGDVVANLRRAGYGPGQGGLADVIRRAQAQPSTYVINQQRAAQAAAMNPAFSDFTAQSRAARAEARFARATVAINKLSSGLSRLGGFAAARPGATGAVGMAGLTALSGLTGGGSNLTKGLTAGFGALGAAGFAIPGVGMIAGPLLSMLGASFGSFVGGRFDANSAAAEKLKQDKAVQAVFGSMTTKGGKYLDRATLLQQLPYQLGALGGLKPGQHMRGITNQSGVATMGAVNILGASLRQMGTAKTQSAFEKAKVRVINYMTAHGIDPNGQLGMSLATLASMAEDRIGAIMAQKQERIMMQEMGIIAPPARRRRRKYGKDAKGGGGRYALEGAGGSVGNDFSNWRTTPDLVMPKTAYTDQVIKQVIAGRGKFKEEVTKTFVSPVRAAGNQAAMGFVQSFTEYISVGGASQIRYALQQATNPGDKLPPGTALPNGTVTSAIGADVRSDGLMYVHRGEKVVPASATRSYRMPVGAGGQGGTVVIQGPLIGKAEIGSEHDAERVAHKLAKALIKHQGNSGRLK